MVLYRPEETSFRTHDRHRYDFTGLYSPSAPPIRGLYLVEAADLGEVMLIKSTACLIAS